MIIGRENYKQWLTVAIRELKTRNRPHDYLTKTLNSLIAQEPNLKTRIDLHDLFEAEAAKPIYPLYCTTFEIWSIQNYGRVPEYDTKLYNQRYKSFLHQSES